MILIKPRVKLQNSPYFCVVKYTRTVKQEVWNEAENRERDWRKTLTFARLDFSTDFEKKKPTVLQSNSLTKSPFQRARNSGSSLFLLKKKKKMNNTIHLINLYLITTVVTVL